MVIRVPRPNRIGVISAIATSVALLVIASCNSQGTTQSGGLSSRGPLEMVVPFSPGGSSDALARVVADVYGSELDREVVVVNKAGAAGAIGVGSVANGSDGAQVLFTTKSSLISVPALQEVEYSASDFDLVASVARQPLLLVVPGDSPYKTMKDLAATDQRIRYGHSGVGAFPDVLQASFYDAAGVNADGVPFDGNGPAITALIGGQVDSAAAEPSVMAEYVKSGKARYIGVFAEERLDALPDVPTFAERGYDVANVQQDWYILAPAGTDEQALGDLRQAATRTVTSDQVSKYLNENVAEPLSIEPDEWSEVIEKEMDSYVQLLDRLGLNN